MRRAHLLPLALAALGAASSSAGETTESWARWSRDRAETLEATGQYEDAIEEWMSLAQLRPDDVMPYSRAAVLAVETPVLRGKDLDAHSPTFAAAQQFVRLAIARGGQGDAGIAYAIGRLYFAEGKWAMSWSTLSDAKQWGFDPVRVRYWHYRAAVNRSAALIDAGRAQDAVDELEFLRKAQPGHPEERALLVDLAAANLRIQQPGVAAKILEDIIAKSPAEADAHYLLGIVNSEAGRLPEAERCYADAMRYATASYSNQTYRSALLKLCDIQIKLDKLDEAEKTAQQFQSLDKDDADGLHALGRVQQAKQDLAAAALNFRRVARMRPNWLENLINLQQVLHLAGADAEAQEVGVKIEELKRKREAEEAKDRLPLTPTKPDPERK